MKKEPKYKVTSCLLSRICKPVTCSYLSMTIVLLPDSRCLLQMCILHVSETCPLNQPRKQHNVTHNVTFSVAGVIFFDLASYTVLLFPRIITNSHVAHHSHHQTPAWLVSALDAVSLSGVFVIIDRAQPVFRKDSAGSSSRRFSSVVLFAAREKRR